MVSKRHGNEQDSDGFKVPFQVCKRRTSASRDVMPGISFDDIVSHFEPCFRRVVQEEVERRVLLFLHPSPRSTLNKIDSTVARKLQLQFVNKLPSLIYTGSKIESRENGSIEVVIIDATSNATITTGPLSSLKIQIVVLDGDFGKDGQEDWTEEEFNHHVMHKRKGKRPLVAGESIVTMKNGVGYVCDINITDNSHWTRSGKFRLGAQLVVQNVSSEVGIREARSEAFTVKDQRGESYKKHPCLSLGDKVWRLKGIAKDGKIHVRLTDNGIFCVEDLLRLYTTNPFRLREILGRGRGTWDTIIKHATACVVGDKLYVYHSGENQLGLLFDSIYKVVGVTDGQSYWPVDSLKPSVKDLVEMMKQHAYKNVKDIVPVVNSINPVLSIPLPMEPLHDPSILQYETQQNFNHLSSPSNVYQDGTDSEISAGNAMQFSHMLKNSFVIRDIWSAPFNEGNEWCPLE